MNEDKVGSRAVVKNRSVAEGRFLCDRSWELGWAIEDASQGGPVWVMEQGIG
jgi:hypothetical protein